MKQQIDPMAQALQILQVLSQRRGQQANIDQGNRGLDLEERRLQNSGQQFDRTLGFQQAQGDRAYGLDQQRLLNAAQQFDQTMGFQQEQFGAQKGQNAFQQKQWETEQANAQVRQALETMRDQRDAPVKNSYMQAQTDQMTRPNTPENDPRMAMIKEAQLDRTVNFLQSQLPITQNPVERQRLTDYLNEIMNIKLRPHTPAELDQMKLFAPQQ